MDWRSKNLKVKNHGLLLPVQYVCEAGARGAAIRYCWIVPFSPACHVHPFETDCGRVEHSRQVGQVVSRCSLSWPGGFSPRSGGDDDLEEARPPIPTPSCFRNPKREVRRYLLSWPGDCSPQSGAYDGALDQARSPIPTLSWIRSLKEEVPRCFGSCPGDDAPHPGGDDALEEARSPIPTPSWVPYC